MTSLDEERIILQDGGCLESDTSEVEEDEKDPAKKEKKAEMETELNMKMIQAATCGVNNSLLVVGGSVYAVG